MQKWEYRIEHLIGFTSTIEDTLNALGREGWELITELDNDYYIFKRPLEY
jgi:hypothetical protein